MPKGTAGVLAFLILSLAAGAWAGGVVYPSPEEVQPLQPGAKVPSVRVHGVEGRSVDLAEAVRDQGALLVFYRGGW